MYLNLFECKKLLSLDLHYTREKLHRKFLIELNPRGNFCEIAFKFIYKFTFSNKILAVSKIFKNIDSS